MKNLFNSLRQFMVVAMILGIGVSCSDKWDDYYSTDSAIVHEKTIGELLLAQEMDISATKFVQALKTTKMLDISDDTTSVSFFDFLNSDQFVTVWVPSNGSMTDAEWEVFTKPDKTEAEHVYAAKRLIMNHIARYNYSLGNDTKKVIMMNGKNFTIYSDQKIDTVSYKETNIPCSNGIIHILDNSKLNYLPTIYEFIVTDPRYRDVLGKFFESYTTEELDENRSVASGINDEGEMVYIDSVMYKINILMSRFGRIDDEDSTYVMVLPTPEGFKEQYDSILSEYDYGSVENADSLQRFYSHTAMLYDAFFNMNLQKSPKDSVVSTRYSNTLLGDVDPYEKDYHRFYNPYDRENGLFYKGLQDSVICSNGIVYITEKWNFDKYLVYNTPVITNAGSGQFEMKQTGGGLPVSFAETTYNQFVPDRTVLRVSANSPTFAWRLAYSIHGVLKTKYRLKLVIAADPSVSVANRKAVRIHPIVKFYKDGNIKNVDPANVSVLVDEFVMQAGRKRDVLYPENAAVKPNDVDTITVNTIVDLTDVTTPGYSTYGQTKASLQVEIINGNTTGSSVNTYSSILFLDRIILEPVKE